MTIRPDLIQGLWRCVARWARSALAAAPVAAVLGLLPGAARAADAPACPPAARTLTMDAFRAGLHDANDHGFFWRISKDGRTSYLYGTIHAARFEWMFPGPTVYDALRASDTLALELNVIDPDIQRRLAASVVSSHAEALPDDLRQRLSDLLKAECVDVSLYAHLSPEFQVASLSVLVARRDGLDPTYAIDLVLARLAQGLEKPIVSLETPEAQMQALQMPTQAETIQFVADGLDDIESGRARPLLNRMAKVWTESDYAELSRYEQWCECARTAIERAAMKRLLEDRNPTLASSIDALHASGKHVFAAVGALHMIGPSGLPTLLRQRGYKVEQAEFGR